MHFSFLMGAVEAVFLLSSLKSTPHQLSTMEIWNDLTLIKTQDCHAHKNREEKDIRARELASLREMGSISGKKKFDEARYWAWALGLDDSANGGNRVFVGSFHHLLLVSFSLHNHWWKLFRVCKGLSYVLTLRMNLWPVFRTLNCGSRLYNSEERGERFGAFLVSIVHPRRWQSSQSSTTFTPTHPSSAVGSGMTPRFRGHSILSKAHF